MVFAMIRICRLTICGLALPLGAACILAPTLLLSASAGRAQNPAPPEGPTSVSSPAVVKELAAPAVTQQKRENKNSNLEKTKADAAELSVLADQIRDELNKMNVNVLPLDVIEKAEKVEQLARKIKGEAHGH